MKKLLIYYSLTGNGDLLAEYLKGDNFEIRKVTEKKKMPKSFFFRVLAGGFRAGIKAKAKLVEYDNDVSKFDEVLIGSPIWNGRFPPVLNSVIEQTDFSGKRISFIFYSGSGEGKKAEEQVKKQFPDAEIVFLKEPKKNPEELKKVENFR